MRRDTSIVIGELIKRATGAPLLAAWDLFLALPQQVSLMVRGEMVVYGHFGVLATAAPTAARAPTAPRPAPVSPTPSSQPLPARVSTPAPAPGSGATLTVSPPAVPVGGTITVTWSGIPNPDQRDVLAGEVLRSGRWTQVFSRYINSLSGSCVCAASGSLSWTLPATAGAGTYRVSLVPGAGGRSSYSNTFDIAASPSPGPATPTPSAAQPQGPLAAPLLLSPADGAELPQQARRNPSDGSAICFATTPTWTFSWTAGDPRYSSYRLVVQRATALYALIDKVVVGTSFTDQSCGYALDENRSNWRWYVVGVTAGGQVGPASETRSFSVAPLQSAALPEFGAQITAVSEGGFTSAVTTKSLRLAGRADAVAFDQSLDNRRPLTG